MSAADSLAKTGGLPAVLTIDPDAPTAPVTAITGAHDVFMERVPQLLAQLAISEEADASATKRVAVRGVLLNEATSLPSVKFSAEYRDGKLWRVRLMTVVDAIDPATVPVEMGGSGIMAPPSSEAPKRKRAKAEASDAVTLSEVLERAIELARLADRTELIRELETLLASV